MRTKKLSIQVPNKKAIAVDAKSCFEFSIGLCEECDLIKIYLTHTRIGRPATQLKQERLDLHLELVLLLPERAQNCLCISH